MGGDGAVGSDHAVGGDRTVGGDCAVGTEFQFSKMKRSRGWMLNNVNALNTIELCT